MLIICIIEIKIKVQINFGVINNLYKSSRKPESLSLTSTLILHLQLNPGQANCFLPSDRLNYDLKYTWKFCHLTENIATE
jgi:hypothetical protein